MAALVLPSAAASAQVPPPTLTGETLLAGLFAPGTSSVVVTSANCDPTGTSSFTYQASGPAGGPYPGTFTEIGTVSMGPQTIPGTPPNGTLTSWTASFTISSPVGNIRGTKTLQPSAPSLPGICKGADVLFPAQRSAATGIQNALAYTATITVPGGAQFTDHGGSDASVNEFPDIPAFNNFFEGFTSQQATTTPVCDENSQGNQDQVLNDPGCQNP
ncbi:MAG: hypothetical protein ACJ77A_05200 [Actinomycetota bacterium]